MKPEVNGRIDVILTTADIVVLVAVAVIDVICGNLDIDDGALVGSLVGGT